MLSIAYSADNKLIVSCSGDSTLRVWDAHTGSTVKLLEGQTRGVRCVACANSANLVASGSSDRTVCVWKVEVQVRVNVCVWREKIDEVF